MANKFGLNFGAGIKELKLGRTFNKGCKDESYHTIRYDFKPASVDPQKDGTLEVVDKEVTLTIPTEGGGLSQAAVFKGNKLPASKDCLLIIDNDTGEMVLERISQNIRVKKTRAEGSSKKILPRAPQPDSRLLSKSSSSQNHSTSSPNVPRPSPSHTGRSPSSKSPTHRNAASKKQNNSSSMPMLNFEEDNKHNSIMSDSSSDSDSNSGSSSSSDSDSDSEPEVPPVASINGTHGAPNKNHKSPSSILSDLELSEED